jgi:hypothetical protein
MGFTNPQEDFAFPELHIAASHAQTKLLRDACQVPTQCYDGDDDFTCYGY